MVALVDRHVREATRIGEHTIPAGAILAPNIYLAQRREDLYPDPAAFRPERFVGHPPPGLGWFPFGGGLRRCVGASFATFEMQVVIPEVLRAVTLRPASRRPARIRREAVTFVPHDGARCVLTARHGVDALAGAPLHIPSKRLVSRVSPAWKPSGPAAATMREMSACPSGTCPRSGSLSTGELDGQKAFMQGKVKIAGKMLRMMQLRGPLEKVQTALTAIDTEY